MRRLWPLTIPLYCVAWATLTALMPGWLPLSMLLGAWRGRSFVVLRLLVFLWVYLSLALVTLLRSIAVRFGDGQVGRDEALLRLGGWYGAALFTWCVRLLSMSVVIEGKEHLTEGPLVVLVRHASIVDAALPAALFARARIPLHYVLKTELRMEPCIDVLGSPRLHAFIDRQGTPLREQRKIATIARSLGDHAIVLYPEGTRFSEAKRVREIEQLERSRPELAAMARSMTHVLSPRLAGPLAALDAAPTADCLIVAHRGLKDLAAPRDFLRGNAVGRELRVCVRRIARQSLPPPPERPRWLFEQWKEVDDFAAGRTTVRPKGKGERASVEAML